MAYNTRNMNTTIKKFAFFALMAVVILSFSIPASAQVGSGNNGKSYKLLAPLPCIPSQTPNATPCTSSGTGKVSLMQTINLGDYFQYVFNFLIAISAAAAVFMIVYGGFQYVTTDSWTGKNEGKDKFWNAITGLLMVLCAYLILKTVNPKLVALPAAIPPISADLLKQGKADQLAMQNGLNQLNEDAGAFQQQGQQSVNAARQAQNTVNDLQQQRSDLQSQLDTMRSQNLADTDPLAITNLETQIAQKDDQIKNAQATKIVESANSSMSNGVISQTLQNLSTQTLNSSMTLESINHEYQTGIDALTQIKNNSNTQLDQLNAPAQKQQVNDRASYAAAVLEVVKDQAIVNNISGSDAIYSQIKTSLDHIENLLPTVTDPALKADLQSRLQTAKDNYNTAKKKYDINSTYEL